MSDDITSTLPANHVPLPAHLYEEWRTVEGTEGAYDVSDLGRLRSWINTRRVRQDEPHLMNPTTGKNGYPVWCHRMQGRELRLTVHVTVATAFHGPKPTNGRSEVRHRDNDKMNNRADNLVWGTPKQNADDRVKAGTSLSGERSPFAKLTASEVAQIRALAADKWIDAAGTEWIESEVAEFFGVTRASIVRILRNETWKVNL